MRRLVWMMLAAGLIIAGLIMYSSFQCRVTKDQLNISTVKALPVISTPQGYAVGFRFNMTNLGGCEVTLGSIQVTLRQATYMDGSQSALSGTESQDLVKTLAPGLSTPISYIFNSPFVLQPTKLNLHIEVTVSGTGTITVFDGDLDIPQ